MIVELKKSRLKKKKSVVKITGSKSESNRLLILQTLFNEIQIENLSNSDDTLVLKKALRCSLNTIDIHHAGTAMRFLTAYFSIQKGREVLLTGSKRMKERPIGVLVDALRALGADISYEENEGFPPLRIKGKELTKNKVSLKADVSSQYISALLLVGAAIEKGLSLKLEGEITSAPYIKMTLDLLNQIGIDALFVGKTINILPSINEFISTQKKIVVESDWSSASYFYSLIALSDIGKSISLSCYKKTSLQGDAALVEIYKKMGVETIFDNDTIHINKVGDNLEPKVFDLKDTPDIAQTIAVTCFGLGVSCDLYGLHTLKIKETDRLRALQIELEKLGGVVRITDNSFHLKENSNILENVKIDTYQDHRMAMAFAPLALRTSIIINDAEVVSKSFPSFWEKLKQLGISINKI